MPISDQYKLFHSATVRAGGGRGIGRSARYGASVDVLTPNLEEFGHRPFSEQDLQSLAQRLLDPKWPRGAPNIYGLEGLLTALLVLPVGLRPGAWLPLVWNESGWKIPAALQGAEQFHEFIESILGFMRTIDKGLLETPPRFASTLDILAVSHRPKTSHARQDWAQGFGLALSQSDNLKIRPDSITHRALFAIAIHANPSLARIYHGHKSTPTLHQSVLTLAEVRTSRGPLGPLPTRPKEARIAPAHPNPS